MPERTVLDRHSPPAGHRAPETVTFLFTDVEGSTRLWERYPDAMASALKRHEGILRAAIDAAGGTVVKTMGDGLMAVFPAASAAVQAGVVAQLGMLDEPWPETCHIRVRIGIHSGEADAREGDYFGPAVNRTARIMAAGHGGQVLVSASTAALTADHLPDRASLRDLGEHRLKDLELSERLYQLVHPDLAADFPPLSTLDLRPNNLPTQASAFIGRDAELTAIRRQLTDENVRLVTLTGPGGAGKTRLALRAAADEIDRFPDGVFFVDLSSATDTDAVVAHVSTALGLSEARDRSPLDDLKRELRPRRLLLVLDNFEQVTASGPTVVDLLADCRSLKVLVTSREALRVRGEHIVSVPPLALPHVSASPPSAVELSQFEAIQLFVERARAVRADFRLTDDNAAAVAEICRRLDGLPLAIELATARLSLFPPDALRERLTSRLKLLRGGARDLPARQQTLRATIEWSYQLLDPGEQRLFELLSVFATAGLESIEAIAADLEPVSHLDAVDGVASLLDKSLIRQAEPTGDDGSPRVTMLETIREFAAERLDAQPSFAGAARDRHARYFAELASRLAAHLADGRSPSGDTINLELENLRIAWRRSVAERDTNRLNQLADALWPVYDGRGWYHATVGLIRDQLAVLETEPPGEERWRRELTLRMNLARALTLLRGYTGEVEDAFAKALALFEGQRERPQLFPVLRALASFHGYRGEDDKAAELAREILELADRQADQSMRVEGEFLLGISLTFGSDLEGGLQLLDHAIASFEAAGYRPRPLRLGNDPRVACLTTSGFALWLRGNPDEAVQRADRAIRLAEELDHPYSLAYALYHCGFLHYWRREPMIVRARADALLRLVGVNDLPIWRALGTCLLGAATSAAGDPETGLRLFRDGLDQYQGLRTPPVFWPFLRFLEADGHVEAQRPAEGMRLIDEALAQAGADQLLSPLFHIVRGDLLMLLDPPDVDGARHAYEVAHEVSRMHGARMLQVRAAVRSTRIAPAADRAGWLATIGALYDSIIEGRGTPDLVEARQLVAGG